MYLEGLRTFIPGCFLDCAVSNSVGVSEDSLPVTVIERSVGVGLSLRYCQAIYIVVPFFILWSQKKTVFFKCFTSIVVC